jgi:hypothetical protein
MLFLYRTHVNLNCFDILFGIRYGGEIPEKVENQTAFHLA